MTAQADAAAIDDALKEAAGLLHGKRRVVVFTGAGVSKESGIDTFRDIGGLWEMFPPDEFATVSGLAQTAMKDPKRLAQFLKEVLHPIAHASPNAAHDAISKLEDHFDVDVITQNVDHLHQDAGSSRVHEVHGSLFRVVDPGGQPLRVLRREQMKKMAADLNRLSSSRFFTLPRVLRAVQPLLGLGASVMHRPNVVLFGEGLNEPDWSKAQKAAERADVMLMVGTSGTVWPAADLPLVTAEAGGKIIGVGPEEGDADLWLQGNAATVVPALLRQLKAEA